MAKWANYLASAKRMSSDSSKISHLKVHLDLDDSIGDGKLETRSNVISNIEGGLKYCTIYKNGNDGKYSKGSEINVILTINGKYLRTDKNSITQDNLGNLPDC